jgi:predicted nucleic acid-binding protein
LTTEAVTNSTCLIGLERIGWLDLLPRVFSKVLAPPMVAKEIRTSVSWLKVEAVKNVAVVATLKTQMDAGEAEAIALAAVIPEIKPLISALLQADFRISERIVEEALRLSGEN